MSRHNSLSLFNAERLFLHLLSTLFPLVERTLCRFSFNPLDFFQVKKNVRFSFPVWLSSVISAGFSCELAGVYMIEFYKANSEYLHWEEGALIELSNTNLPGDFLTKTHPKHFFSVSVLFLYFLPAVLTVRRKSRNKFIMPVLISTHEVGFSDTVWA